MGPCIHATEKPHQAINAINILTESGPRISGSCPRS